MKMRIFKILCLIAYIVCVVVLIIESAMNGSQSSAQSNAVGGAISDIVNDANGDQTVVVLPTAVTITNECTNNTINGKTGESLQLTIKTTPENATYQSYIYKSSNEKVASIDENGLIKFISEGEATIIVTNDKFNEVTNSIKVIVTNIKLNEINAWIESNTDGIINPIIKSGVYELYAHTEYVIKYDLEPSNATDKSISFSTIDNPYISLTEDGYIIANALTNEPINITLSCACGETIETIKVIVIPTQETIFDSLALSDSDNTLETIVTKPINPTIKANYKIFDLTIDDSSDFIISTSNYSSYTLSTDDTDIVDISGKKIIGKSEGKATIKATSTEDENKFCEFYVEVLPQQKVNSYTIAGNKTYTYKEGDANTHSLNISLSGDNKYYIIDDFDYSSSDQTVLKIIKEDKAKVTFEILKANAEVTLTTTINGISKTTQIKTIEPEQIKDNAGEITIIDDFEISKTNESQIIKTNQDIDLTKYYTVKWKDVDGNTLQNGPSGTFTYSSDNENIKIFNSILNSSAPGKITIAIHFDGYEDKYIELYAINEYTLISNDTEINSDINMNVAELFTFEINTNNNINQSYNITYSDTSNISYSSIDDYRHSLRGISDGSLTVTVTPYLIDVNADINLLIKDIYSKTINITMKHILTDSISISSNITHHDNTTEDFDFTKDIYLNDKIHIDTIINKNATTKEIRYSSSDEEILTISNTGDLTPLKTGEVTITIKETKSGLQTERTIKIINLIKLEETNPITISGQEATYNESNKTFSLVNGYAASIKVNFKDYSTYKSVTYASSNEKILTVGKDGKITTLKPGKATITVICDDGAADEPQLTLEINLEVKRQNIIKDISKFFYQIRKGLGHFGAFLVLGIFSTLTYLLFFRGKHLLWSVPLNIAAGFGVAALTEYIQTLVPGRSGNMNDVMLDFTGFMFSAVILTIGILLIYLINYIRKRSH